MSQKKSEPNEEATTNSADGYLIDPVQRTIVLKTYHQDYKTITEAIGGNLFDVVRFNDKGDVAYIDDEGMLKNPEFFFAVNGYYAPLAGRGWVLGTDEAGNTITPTVRLKWLKENVLFYQILGNFGGRVLAEVVPAIDLTLDMLVDMPTESGDTLAERFKDFAKQKEEKDAEIAKQVQ